MTANEPKCECGADDYNDRLLKRTGPGEGMRFVPHALNCPTAPKESKPEPVIPRHSYLFDGTRLCGYGIPLENGETAYCGLPEAAHPPAPPTPEPVKWRTFAPEGIVGITGIVYQEPESSERAAELVREAFKFARDKQAREEISGLRRSAAQPTPEPECSDKCNNGPDEHDTDCPNAKIRSEPKEFYRTYYFQSQDGFVCPRCGCLVGDRAIHDVKCGKGGKG